MPEQRSHRSWPGLFYDEELDRPLEKYISNYCKFLGQCLLLGQTKNLNYHKRKLAEPGIDLRWSHFAKGMFGNSWVSF